MQETARRLGFFLIALAILAFALRFTMLPAILPVDAIVLGTALAGITLAGLGIAKSHKGISRTGKSVVALSLVCGAWSALALASQPTRQVIAFQSKGTELVGDLYLPSARCPCPAVVFVHGSGPSPSSDYDYYARQMAQRGIVSFAFDKRGSGRSAGDLHDGGYKLYARNVADAVAAIKARPQVDSRRVSLIGYSEGEWVAPLAAQLTDVASIVVVGASGLSPVQQGDEQAAIRMAAAGFGASDISDMLRLSAATRAYERSGKGREALLRLIEPLHRRGWFDLAGNLPHPDELATFELYGWWRSYMDTDPVELWRNAKVPVLFLKGGRDDHSDAAKSIARLKAVRPDAKVKIYPDADHILVRYLLGGRFPPAVFADYFELVADFVKRAPPTPVS